MKDDFLRSILPPEKVHVRYAREHFPIEPEWIITCMEQDKDDIAQAFAAHGLNPKINGI